VIFFTILGVIVYLFLWAQAGYTVALALDVRRKVRASMTSIDRNLAELEALLAAWSPAADPRYR
jgi:hypothetical protein